MCYELAWTYFPKGTVIYCGAGDCKRPYRVMSTEYSYHVLSMNCKDIGFDRSKFECRTNCLQINESSGNRPILSLPHYLLLFYHSLDPLKERLITHGKLVLEYQNLKHRENYGAGRSDEGQRSNAHFSESIHWRFPIAGPRSPDVSSLISLGTKNITQACSGNLQSQRKGIIIHEALEQQTVRR